MPAKKMIYCSFRTNKNIQHEKKKQLAPHYNVKTSLIYAKSLILSCRKNRTNCMKVWRERVEKEKRLSQNDFTWCTCARKSTGK